MSRSGWSFPLSVALCLVVVASASLHAHEKKAIGQLQLTIGWGEEPAFTGFRNTADVDVTDASGVPVKDPGAALSIEISFGSDRITRPMVAAYDRPGKFRTVLVPTRSGTYAFHITGTIKGQTIDATSTCSPQTFACVADRSEVEFPAKDPSAAELAQGISRALPRADEARATATTARNIGIAAITTAVIALVAAIGLGRLRGKQGV